MPLRIQIRRLLLGLALWPFLFTTEISRAQQVAVADQPSNTTFPLVDESPASLLIDEEDHAVVSIVANLLSDDVERVTKKKPAVLRDLPTSSGRLVLIGTLGKSRYIDALANTRKLDVSAIRGQWESFVIVAIEKPFPHVEEALVIAGSDRRGTAYGALTLSESIGVSPWYYWADVPTRSKQQLHVSRDPIVQGPSPIKYRGIFINDEDWGLQPWAAKNIDTDIQDIGPKTYAKIFELMLRLKANYLWPAMHDCTRAFNDYPKNKLVADQYAIVMGASHCEPMLRNNVTEWDASSMGDWNYQTNSERIYGYWESRVKRNAKFENLYTLGMRGIHDSKMPGGGTLEEKRIRLEQIVRDQRQIISDHVHSDASQVPQIFCPYKEVLQIYQRGMRLPEDVTLVWPDDNYGYIRNLSTPAERKRSGGTGIYYHMSYLGHPQDYLWLGSTSPALIAYELQKAYAYGSDRLWIFNVGDIKPLELEMEFALRLAYDPAAWPANKAMRFIESWAKRTFGEAHAASIARLLHVYYQLTQQAKPEHIDRVEFTEQERDRRFDQYAEISAQARRIMESLDPKYHDAFFQLVLYPVQCADLMNRRQTYSLRGEAAKALRAYEEIQKLTQQYNQEIAGGKWDGMMDMAPRTAKVFRRPDPKWIRKNDSKNPPLLEVSITDSTRSGGMRLTDEGLRATTPGLQPEDTSSKVTLEFSSPLRQKADLYFLAKCQTDKQDSWYVSLNQRKTLSNNQPTGSTFKWLRIMRVDLEKGRNELMIKQRESGTIIQRIALVRPGRRLTDTQRIPDHVFAAAEFSSANDTNTSRWVEIEGLGIESSAMTLMPYESESFSQAQAEQAPCISYRFRSSAGRCAVEARFLPTHRINHGMRLRYAVRVDEGPIKMRHLDATEWSRTWSTNVLRGFSSGETRHVLQDSEEHQIKLYLLDPGIVLSQIRTYELD